MNDLYGEIVDAMAVLVAMANEAKPINRAYIDVHRQHQTNKARWGRQDMNLLFVVLGEEVGKIARAMLEATEEVEDQYPAYEEPDE